MKKLENAILAVMLFCLAGSVVLIALSPDTVPVHYNAAGEIDRFGSRYEGLLFPLSTAAMGAFFLLYARYYTKKGVSYSISAKILLYTGVCITLFFTAMGFYFLWKAMTYDPAATVSSGAGAVMTFTGVAIGVLLIVLGNIMPKARRNTLFGLRTKWSLSSDAVWQRSQRFAGISGVVCGLVVIVLSSVLPGLWNLLAITAVTAVWCVLCVAASYRYYREEAGPD